MGPGERRRRGSAPQRPRRAPLATARIPAAWHGREAACLTGPAAKTVPRTQPAPRKKHKMLHPTSNPRRVHGGVLDRERPASHPPAVHSPCGRGHAAPQ